MRKNWTYTGSVFHRKDPEAENNSSDPSRIEKEKL